MSIEIIISWVVALASLIGAIAAIVKAYKTSPGERVDVAQKYQQIAAKAAEDAEKANARCDALETQVKDQNKVIDAMKKTIEEYRHGIAVLVHQLEADGIVPAWKPRD